MYSKEQHRRLKFRPGGPRPIASDFYRVNVATVLSTREPRHAVRINASSATTALGLIVKLVPEVNQDNNLQVIIVGTCRLLFSYFH